MSYNELFQPVYFFETPALEKFSKFQASVTKLSVDGSDPSPKQFQLRFHCGGKIIAFFEGPPKSESPPRYIINVKEISDLFDAKIQGDEVIQLKIINESIALKFEKSGLKKDFFEAISAFKGYFDKQGQTNELKSEFKEELSPLLDATIAAELESVDWQNIKKGFEPGNFCKDKKIKELIDSDPKMLKNRLLISQVVFDVKTLPNDQIDKKRLNALKKAPTTKVTLKPITEENFNGGNMYLLLVSQKTLSFIDQRVMGAAYENMGGEALPEPLEFNCLYFYTYDNQGDVSGMKKILPAMFFKKRNRFGRSSQGGKVHP